MMDNPSLDDWVWVLAMVNQAMLGVLSTNIRQISLSYDQGWEIEAILENFDETDVEDIEDVAVETNIFLEDIINRLSPCAYAKVSVFIIVDSRLIQSQNKPNCRIIYRRKEV